MLLRSRLVDGHGGPDAPNDAGDEAYVEIERTEPVGGPPEISPRLLPVAILATARWTSRPPGVPRTIARADQRRQSKSAWSLGLGRPVGPLDVLDGVKSSPTPPATLGDSEQMRNRSRSHHSPQGRCDPTAGHKAACRFVGSSRFGGVEGFVQTGVIGAERSRPRAVDPLSNTKGC